jgi:lipid A 3-O-deacylase
MNDGPIRRGPLAALQLMVWLEPTGSAAVPLAADDATPSVPASAASASEASSASLFDAHRYEVRFGAFAHGVGSAEQGTVDLNPELVFPRLHFGEPGRWNVLVPRPHLGGLINLEGRTSSFYAGALWSLPLSQRFFAEIFLDGANHDGYDEFAPPGRSDLGCPFLFHSGGSSGYNFDRHWSLIVTFDHRSNGHSLFGIECEGSGAGTHNAGINDYGARIGYSF